MRLFRFSLNRTRKSLEMVEGRWLKQKKNAASVQLENMPKDNWLSGGLVVRLFGCLVVWLFGTLRARPSHQSSVFQPPRLL